MHALGNTNCIPLPDFPNILTHNPFTVLCRSQNGIHYVTCMGWSRLGHILRCLHLRCRTSLVLACIIWLDRKPATAVELVSSPITVSSDANIFNCREAVTWRLKVRTISIICLRVLCASRCWGSMASCPVWWSVRVRHGYTRCSWCSWIFGPFGVLIVQRARNYILYVWMNVYFFLKK